MHPEVHLGITPNFSASEIVATAAFAEADGCQALWLSDIRFSRDCFVLLGAIAGGTRRIQLGTGVSDAYSRHPAVLAAAAATLDELAPGRVVIGLGAGGSGLAQIAGRRIQPVRTVEAAIRGIRALWAGSVVNVKAPTFEIVGGELSCVPMNSIQVAVAANGPMMYRLAGRLADKVIIGRYSLVSAIEMVRSFVREGVRARDPELDPLEEVWRIDVCIDDQDPQRAHDKMRNRTRNLLMTGYRNEGFLNPIGFGHLASSGNELSADVFEDLVKQVTLAGSYEEVRSRIKQVISEVQLHAVCCVPYPVGGQDLRQAARMAISAVRD